MSIKNKGGHYLRTVATHGRKSGHWLTQYAKCTNVCVIRLFQHALAGFNYVEVEFSTVEQAKSFVPPDWFGREVTEDARFSYGTLAHEDGMELVRRLLIDK